MTKAYCLSCRKKMEVKNEKVTTTKNGRKMLKGTCNKCGRAVFQFMKSE